MILLAASATLTCGTQDAPPPAARATPAAPQATPAPPKPHLTTAFPAAKPQTPAATSSTPVAPATISKPALPTGPAAIALLSGGGFNRTVVVLDPGHGGNDTGSRMNDQLTEKDVTLALAYKIRSLLNARGFTVVMTRENDSDPAGAQLSLDDRAGIANHARPVACLLLHATGSGRGVHLYTSELTPTDAEAIPAPWLTAQAPWVAQSQKLAAQIGAAMGRAKIRLVSNNASIRPVDSLTCPAVVLELAPNSDDAATLNDGSYQQHIAEVVASAMVFWQNQAQPPARQMPPPPVTPASGVTP